jgi:hypothetical protein
MLARVALKVCYNEADTAWSGQNNSRNLTDGFSDANAGIGTTSQTGTNPSVLNPVGSASSLGYNVGQGMRTDGQLKLLATAPATSSTRWHSQLRKSP